MCCSSCHWGESNPTHLLNLCLQAFLVAGGWTLGLTSSVVTLLPGATAWTPLASLPRPLSSAQASIVGGRLRVTGGHDDGYSRRSEVMSFHLKVTLYYKQIHMQYAHYHAHSCGS